MSKKIEVRFCGANGLGGTALSLKNKIMEAIPGVQIERVEAESETNSIEVICKGTFDDCLWSNGKSDTEKNHATIINKVRTALG